MRDSVFGRRLLILVAVLMGLMAVVASFAPPPQRGARTPAPASPTPSPSAGAPGNASDVIARRVDANGPDVPVRIDVPRGHTLELTVAVGGPDSVAFGELDVDAADAGSPAQFELYADLPGEYPLSLVNAGRRIGVVRVTR
jgi:hypothetical protein